MAAFLMRVIVCATAMLLAACVPRLSGQEDAVARVESLSVSTTRPSVQLLEIGVPPTKASSSYSLNLVRRYLPPPPWILDTAVIGPEFTSVEIGDFNGDRRDDVAALVSGATPEHPFMLYLLLQTPAGDLAPATPFPLSSYEGGPYYNSPQSMTRGDFNNDGITDLVLTRGRGISILVADGSGGFRSTTYSADRAFPLPAVVLDVNRDGHQDVVAFTTLLASERGAPRNGFVVHYGDGKGGIGGHSEIRTSGAVEGDGEIGYSLATGDLNSDGYPDLVARISEFDINAQRWRHVVSVHLHDTRQGFLPALKINAVLTTGQELLSLEKVTVADFNRDGLADLVATAESHRRREIHVFAQKTDGTLETTARVKSIYNQPTALDPGDLDGDGYLDLLVAHSGWNNIGYLLQGPDGLEDQVLKGVFAEAPGIGLNSQAIGDLNGDGCNDAVVVGQWEAMSVLHGSGCVNRIRHTGGNAVPRLVPGS